jgi:hypothetical protein
MESRSGDGEQNQRCIRERGRQEERRIRDAQEITRRAKERNRGGEKGEEEKKRRR